MWLSFCGSRISIGVCYREGSDCVIFKLIHVYTPVWCVHKVDGKYLLKLKNWIGSLVKLSERMSDK